MASNIASAVIERLRLDLVVAGAGVLFSVLVIPVYFWLSNLFILGLPLVTGIASILYLSAADTERDPFVGPLPAWASRLFPSLCLLGMAALVAIVSAQGARTLPFYLVGMGVAVLIFYQIIFAHERDFSPTLVLGQILALAFILRFAALYTTPGFVGIDIWTHVPNWTAAIVDSQSLAPISEHKYYAAPWFHLLTASTAILGDLPLDWALHLSVGLVMVLLVLLVYATARIVMDQRWSTFVAGMFAIIGYSVEWSIHLIPTSLGLALFVGIFYLLCRMLFYRFNSGEFLLLAVLNIAVVLTHQIATFITLILLVASVIALLLLQAGLFASETGGPRNRGLSRESANLIGLTVFDLGFVTFMWSLTPFHGRSFLETMWIFFHDTLTQSEGFGDLASQRGPEDAPEIETTFLEQVVSVLDASVFLLLFLFTALGALYVLRPDERTYPTFMMGSAIAAMCVFVFGFPLFGIRSFVPTRWFAFMAVPMMLLAALGMAYLLRQANPTVAVTFVLIFVLVFPAVVMVSSSATLDSPPIASEQTRYSYVETELAAVDAVDTSFPTSDDENASAIHTDHPYSTVFERTAAHNATRLELSDEGLAEADVVIYREYQESGAAFFNDPYERAYSPRVSQDQICTPDRHTVYDNGDVCICVAA